jgi:fructose-1-phosphate kinase PfkB-like protein
MILTTTLNPCIDRTLYVTRLRPNRLERTNRVELTTGGKGMNAARVLTALGARAKAFVLLGGETGKHYEALVKNEAIPLVSAWIDVPTRTQTSILRSRTTTKDESIVRDGTNTWVGAPTSWVGVLEEAGMVPNTEIGPIRDKMIAALKGARYLLISGSVPSVNLVGVYREVIEAAHARGIVTALDTYGRALADAIAAGPFMAKPNRRECEALVGHRIRGVKGAKRALASMHERGVRLAIITCGRKGFYAGYEGAAYAVQAPRVHTVNSIGSGDATAAGILYALSNDVPVEQALRWGAAAGAANAAVWAPGGCTANDIRALLERVKIGKVA